MMKIRLQHIEQGALIELVAEDRICEQCRREDGKRPMEARSYQSVRGTLMANGSVIEGIQGPPAGSASRSHSPHRR
jgi:hypothetical protein